MPLANPQLTKFTTASPVIASYNYTDVSEGTGNITFFLCKATNDILSSQTIWSSQIVKTGTFTTPDEEYNFDLTEFNSSRTIKGTALFQMGSSFQDTEGGCASNIYIRLLRVSGAVETALCALTSMNAVNNATSKIVATRNVILTETQFSRGDILRAEVTIVRNGTGTLTYEFGISPLNQDGTLIVPSSDSPATTTISKITVPFKLDL